MTMMVMMIITYYNDDDDDDDNNHDDEMETCNMLCIKHDMTCCNSLVSTFHLSPRQFFGAGVRGRNLKSLWNATCED